MIYIAAAGGLLFLLLVCCCIRFVRNRRADQQLDNQVNPNLLDDTLAEPSNDSRGINKPVKTVDFYSGGNTDGNFDDPFSKNGKIEIEKI